MKRTKKNRNSRKKNKKTQTKKKYLLGLQAHSQNTPNKKWIIDWFGFRKSVPVNKFKTIQSIDKLNLATDYKKNKNIYNFALDEYKNRLLLLLKTYTPSRKLFKRKTKKTYNSRTISKIIDKMDVKKMQNLYFYLLEKEKPKKLFK